MKKLTPPFLIASLLVILVFGAFLAWGVPYFFQKPFVNKINSSLGSQTYRAQVIEIIESGPTDLGGTAQTYQRARVEILEGEYSGLAMEIDYGRYRILPQGQMLIALHRRRIPEDWRALLGPEGERHHHHHQAGF